MADLNDIRQKIQQLLDSKSAENNYLALTLMRTQLKLPFYKAFAKLQMTKEKKTSYSLDKIYYIDILEYRVLFTISSAYNPGADYGWINFDRSVIKDNTSIPKYDRHIDVEFTYYDEPDNYYELMLEQSDLGHDLHELFYQ